MSTLDLHTAIKKAIKTNDSILNIDPSLTIEQITTYVDQYVYIGFCKLAAYTSAAQTRAKFLMSIGIKLKIVCPFDYGRGKGKYNTVPLDLEISEVTKLITNRLINK